MKGNCGECGRRWYCETNPDDCDEWPDPVPMTNADRIRSMSDEELAVWIASVRLDIINILCKKFDVKIEIPAPTVENTAEMREWLQQPVKEE